MLGVGAIDKGSAGDFSSQLIVANFRGSRVIIVTIRGGFCAQLMSAARRHDAGERTQCGNLEPNF